MWDSLASLAAFDRNCLAPAAPPPFWSQKQNRPDVIFANSKAWFGCHLSEHLTVSIHTILLVATLHQLVCAFPPPTLPTADSRDSTQSVVCFTSHELQIGGYATVFWLECETTCRALQTSVFASTTRCCRTSRFDAHNSSWRWRVLDGHRTFFLSPPEPWELKVLCSGQEPSETKVSVWWCSYSPWNWVGAFVSVTFVKMSDMNWLLGPFMHSFQHQIVNWAFASGSYGCKPKKKFENYFLLTCFLLGRLCMHSWAAPQNGDCCRWKHYSFLVLPPFFQLLFCDTESDHDHLFDSKYLWVLVLFLCTGLGIFHLLFSRRLSVR